MSNLLLIDGNNLAHRVFWSHRQFSKKGKYVGLIFGFLKSVAVLRRMWGVDWTYVVAWDAGGSRRRKREAREGVDKGLLSSGYKANRDDEISDDLQCLFDQVDILRGETLPLTNLFQVSVDGYEADDVIYSYAVKNAERGDDTVIVTSDHDFFQVLGPKVAMYDAMKKETWTADRFEVERGYEPKLWVDVGALMGDKSDNIPGVPGWGVKIAERMVREHGDLDAVVAAMRAKGDARNKTEQKLLDNLELARLCYSLKRMDVVPGLPKLKRLNRLSEDALREYLIEMRFATLLRDVKRFV